MPVLTLATRKRCVLEDWAVVAARATADLAKTEPVLVALVDVCAVWFIASSEDVLQVNGHEEAADLSRDSDRSALDEVRRVGNTVEATARIATGFSRRGSGL